jgi:phenylalanyl-tRNA synthetase beta subunit
MKIQVIKHVKKLQACLLNLGFNELIHYSLVNEKTFLKNEIKLINPLLSDYSIYDQVYYQI